MGRSFALWAGGIYTSTTPKWDYHLYQICSMMIVTRPSTRSAGETRSGL